LPPERTAQLIARLREYRERNAIPQATLARALNVSPANLFEILKGKHSPNAEVALHIEEILRNDMTTDKPRTLSDALDKIEVLTAELAKASKATTLPPVTVQKPPAVTSPKPAATQPSVAPKPVVAQLSGAVAPADDRNIGMRFNAGPLLTELSPIDQLRVELNNTKDAAKKAALYRRIKALDGAPGVQVTQDQSPPFDPASQPSWKPLEVATPPPPKRLPESADTPTKIQAILDVTVLDPDLLSMLGNPVHTSLQRSMIFAQVKAVRTLTEGTLS
jgi:transcriptional regulator with XRE-family HTH domain